MGMFAPLNCSWEAISDAYSVNELHYTVQPSLMQLGWVGGIVQGSAFFSPIIGATGDIYEGGNVMLLGPPPTHLI